ncbi:unnamed protein product [Polarella glacialis]|uniref:Guanine nucleotide-binding protein subunit beta-like protein n=1 Tax=Polarella glacialis TaxID=89957 RepID=A0A813JQH0_POLGL|nr:unnamed protein product [Polarella glacialis]
MAGEPLCDCSCPKTATIAEVKADLSSVTGLSVKQLRLVLSEVGGENAELEDGSQLGQHLHSVGEAGGTTSLLSLTLVRAEREHLALSGSIDQTLRLWDLSEGKSIHVLEGCGGMVSGLEVDWETRRALCGSMDHCVRLWDLKSGRCLHAMHGHADTIRGVLVDWPASLALTFCAAGLIILWDLQVGLPRHMLLAHSGTVCDVEVDWDTLRALSIGADCALRLWDLHTGHQAFSVDGLEGSDIEETAEAGLEVSWESNRVISCWAHTLRMQDLATGEVLFELRGHVDDVKGLAVDWEGLRCVSWGLDSQLRLWDLKTGTSIHKLLGHTEAVLGVSVEWADQPRALSCSSDCTLRLWDLGTGSLLLGMSGHSDAVCGLEVDWENKRALSWSDDYNLRLWSLVDGSCVHKLVGHLGPVWSALVDWDSSRALSYSFAHKALLLWNLSLGGPAQAFPMQNGGTWNGGAEVDWDRERAISWSLDDAKLWVIDFSKNADVAVRELSGHSGPVSCVSFESSETSHG